MAKKNRTQAGDSSSEVQAGTATEQQNNGTTAEQQEQNGATAITPGATDRMMRPGMVKLRALRPLNEDGVNRAKGEVFEIDAARAKVLPKDLVESVDE
jgi:hypothetical protein